MGMFVNPRLKAHVTLDQLRKHHLALVGSLSRDYGFVTTHFPSSL